MNSLTMYVIYIDRIFSLLWWCGYTVIGFLFLLRYVLSRTTMWSLFSFGWANLFLSAPFAVSFWASLFTVPQGIAWIGSTFHILGCFFVLLTFLLLLYPHKLVKQWNWPKDKIGEIPPVPEQDFYPCRLIHVGVLLVISGVFILTTVSMINYSSIISSPLPVSGEGAPLFLLPFWAAVVYYSLAAFASFTAGYLGLHTLYVIGIIYKVAFALCLRGLHDIFHIFQIWSSINQLSVPWFLGVQMILLLLAHLLYFEALLPEIFYLVAEIKIKLKLRKGGN